MEEKKPFNVRPARHSPNMSLVNMRILSPKVVQIFMKKFYANNNRGIFNLNY